MPVEEATGSRETRREWAAVACLLLLLFAGIAYEARYYGVTVDEPSHLISSYLWWQGRDRLYPRDMPPLIKIVSGWPAAWMGLPVPADLGVKGDKRGEWIEGSNLIARLPREQIKPVLFWSRLPLSLFALGSGLLLWWWARQLHGPLTAIVLLALWVFSPTPLAHAALVKNDLAATGTFLLFWYAGWRFWREPDLRRAARFGFCAALGMLSKMSMLFLLPVALAILVARALTPPRPPLRQAVLWLVAASAVIYGSIVLACQGEVHWTSPAELQTLARDARIPAWFLASARVFEWIPVPEAMWTGVVSLFRSNYDEVPVYLLGQVFPQGHPLYFTVALALKFPLPALLLLTGGIAAALLRPRFTSADAFWLVPGVLYFLLASAASLQLGVRLILPCWPFFLLVAGLAVSWLLRHPASRVVLTALVLMQTSMTVANYPHGISHFNPYAGPAWNSWRLLNDSNIDWGQALPDLKRYVRENKLGRFRLSYFGFDPPDRHFAPGHVELIPAPWSDQWTQAERYKPEPGWYAISACFLPGHFFAPKYRDYYAEFRNRRPVAVVGGSILIYRVD